jgi:hypothetical protein
MDLSRISFHFIVIQPSSVARLSWVFTEALISGAFLHICSRRKIWNLCFCHVFRNTLYVKWKNLKIGKSKKKKGYNLKKIKVRNVNEKSTKIRNVDPLLSDIGLVKTISCSFTLLMFPTCLSVYFLKVSIHKAT